MKKTELRIKKELDDAILQCTQFGFTEMCDEIKINRSMYGDLQTYKVMIIQNEVMKLLTEGNGNTGLAQR